MAAGHRGGAAAHRRRVTELDESDLVLSVDETAELVSTADLGLAPAVVRRIHRVAEGWPAGLYLLARAAASVGEAAVKAGTPVADYLDEQVLGGLDPEVVGFLTQSSIFDEVDGTACDAVLGRDDSAGILERLSRSHLFVVAVQGVPGRYRYHSLLAGVLHDELARREPGAAAELHLRACSYFADRDVAPAVHHARASGDRRCSGPRCGGSSR